MIYYVSTNGNDKNTGGEDSPFRTINHAAQIAVAGDTVRVHGGEYRECVSPKNGGRSDSERIVFEAVEGERPVIKGSMAVTDWEHKESGVWQTVIPNSVFGDFNPFDTPIEGDWLMKPDTYTVHLGDVYLNGISMYEAVTEREVYTAEKRTEGYHYPRMENEVILRPQETVYRWFASVDDDNTTLICNFQGYDPNKEQVEISVRKSCFFPKETGRDYITVRGFEMAHAATQWAPPTASQDGMIGPNWSKGWIIENNHFHDSKCSAVSLGKEVTTGDNYHNRFFRKSGYHYQMEAVFRALQAGWCKEKIGSHVVRNNVIHDCGQTGIVGHMGCAFSVIEHNHIYNIAKKQEFWGHEIAGIKLHAGIDVVLRNNNIHNCSLGTWLDWEAQGMRVCSNVYHSNDRDFMIEVTHGPCLVDNNLFLSDFSFQNAAQGTAFVHNIIYGYTYHFPVHDRATPYHFPHSTQVLGTAIVHGGDDRIFNNIFFGKNELPYFKFSYMSGSYDKFSTKSEHSEFIQKLGRSMDHDKYMMTGEAVYVESNVYEGLAKPFRAEKDALCITGGDVKIEQNGDKWILTLELPKEACEHKCEAVTTARLSSPRHTEQAYENPDGTAVDLTADMLGKKREDFIAGPFAKLKEGRQQIVVWQSTDF